MRYHGCVKGAKAVEQQRVEKMYIFGEPGMHGGDSSKIFECFVKNGSRGLHFLFCLTYHEQHETNEATLAAIPPYPSGNEFSAVLGRLAGVG